MQVVSQLRKVFPRAEILKRFPKPVVFTEYGLRDIEKLEKKIPLKLHSLGLSVWDRIVQHDLKPVNPRAIGMYVDSRDPALCDRISAVIGEPVIHDLYYVTGRVEDNALANKVAAELLVARVFPNILHLTDVEFSDPYKPLSKAEKKYALQEYAGLGLLGPLIENMATLGKRAGCEYIVLVAGNVDLVPKFRRHGFEVEDTPTSRARMLAGAGPSMERRL